jgi:hypothetical protein
MTSMAAAPPARGLERIAGLRRLPSRAWPLIALTVAAIAIGTFIRASLLGAGSLWLDELWTLDAISRSFREMVGARLIGDVHPPLWSTVAWLWLRVVGTYDAATMRLLPLGFGLAAIVVPLLGAIRLSSLRPTLLVMAAALALSLFPIQYAVELRSYSMLFAFGTSATVIWAGLLVEDLPARGRWIFLFALTGALTGFAHPYGQLLYVGELAVLFAMWLARRRRREVAVLAGWAFLSMLPAVAWYGLTRGWLSGGAVASPPSITTIQTWVAYALSPISNLLGGRGPGYPDHDGPETILLGLAVVVLLGAAAWSLFRRPRRPIAAHVAVGVAALFVVGLGIAVAWLLSIVLPPSMSYRNLAGLLPLLLLAVACAATLPRQETTRWLTGAAVVGLWLVAEIVYGVSNGVPALGPTWQREAGYRSAVDVLLTSRSASPAPTLVGLETAWAWHGQWDAAVRAALGSPPAESDSPPPLDVRWIGDVNELTSSEPSRDRPLIVVSDTFDDREAALGKWLAGARRGCEETTFGGLGFGVVVVWQCP